MKSTSTLPHISAAVSLAMVLAIPQLALAEKLLVITDYGAPKTARVEMVRGNLAKAGHKIVVAGSSLEDTALLLGCDPSEDSCLDSVIATGKVDGLVVVPADEGSILTRLSKANVSYDVSSDGDFDAAVAALVAGTAVVDDAMAGTTTATTTDSGSTGDPAGTDSDTAAGTASPTEPEPLATGAVEAPPEGGSFSVGSVSTRTWIVLGGGVAATGLGLGLLGVASSKQDDVDAHPADSSADLDALRALEDSGNRYTKAGNIFAVFGGVAVLTGVGLLLWDAKQGREQIQTAIIPTASANGVGLAFQWTTP